MNERSGWRILAARALAGAILAMTPILAWAQIERVSLTNAGLQANADSYEAATSDDGTVVAFRSAATDIVAGDTNEWADIFVRDITAGTTELVSVEPDGTQLEVGFSRYPFVSDDGLLVLFGAKHDSTEVSVSTLYDRNAGTSEYLLHQIHNGNPNGPTTPRRRAALSGNGQFVAFDAHSELQNLFEDAIEPADDDTNNTYDVFLYDHVTMPSPQVERLSRNSAGVEGNGDSIEATLSDSGRWVAFHSYANDLVAMDLNDHEDVFVRDRMTGTTELISANSVGDPGNGDSQQAVISGDGGFVVFRSQSSDLVMADSNKRWDVFVRDRAMGTTERASVSSAGSQANHHSHDADISDDGRFVVFRSLADNLVAGDTNGRADIFVRDRQMGLTELVSAPAMGESNGTSHAPAISGDGQWIVFESDATNLVAGDTNQARDIFRAPNPLAGVVPGPNPHDGDGDGDGDGGDGDDGGDDDGDSDNDGGRG